MEKLVPLTPASILGVLTRIDSFLANLLFILNKLELLFNVKLTYAWLGLVDGSILNSVEHPITVFLELMFLVFRQVEIN